MTGTNPVGTWALPLSTGPSVQDPTTYKGNIDADIAVAQRVADAFAPRPASPASMTVVVDAGFIASETPAGLQSVVEVAQQSVTLATAPGAPNSRIDLIAIDAGTGAASVIAGTPGNSPSPPAMIVGKRQVAQIAVPSGATAILAGNITDLRAVWGSASGGRGIPWAIAAGGADAITASYTPATPNPVPDGFIVGVRFIAANLTTAPALNVDTRGNFTITKNGGQPLVAGDIAGNLAEGLFRWNNANSTWEMLNPANPVPSGFTTGDVKTTLKTAADIGWVMMNDGTIGNAASGATTRANADTQALFALLWNNVSDANCPVVGGRGASAAADFAANKKITLPKMLGRALASAGSGSGLTARGLGDTVGAETVTLTAATQASMPVSGGTVSGGSSSPGVITSTSTVGGVPAFTLGAAEQTSAAGCNPIDVWEQGSVSLSGASLSGARATGGGNPHANMQPSSFLNFMIKL
jgi:microcystin-dependent protein